MEIKICKQCKGEGTIVLNDNRHSDGIVIKCNYCNGTGKVKSMECSFELELPSDLSPIILNNANNELFEVYRKYDKIIKDDIINKSINLFTDKNE